MPPVSRARVGLFGVMPENVRRWLSRDSRPPVTAYSLLLEALEDRVLLSRGGDDFGLSSDGRSATDSLKSLAKPQTVELKIADLAADGITVAAQPGGPQDRISALRFDNYLLIGDQFYQYAGGQGYPLIPVAGPILQGDLSVQHSPIPVLLPQQEPAFSTIPVTPTPAVELAGAPVSSPKMATTNGPVAPTGSVSVIAPVGSLPVVDAPLQSIPDASTSLTNIPSSTASPGGLSAATTSMAVTVGMSSAIAPLGLSAPIAGGSLPAVAFATELGASPLELSSSFSATSTASLDVASSEVSANVPAMPSLLRDSLLAGILSPFVTPFAAVSVAIDIRNGVTTATSTKNAPTNGSVDAPEIPKPTTVSANLTAPPGDEAVEAVPGSESSGVTPSAIATSSTTSSADLIATIPQVVGDSGLTTALDFIDELRIRDISLQGENPHAIRSTRPSSMRPWSSWQSGATLDSRAMNIDELGLLLLPSSMNDEFNLDFPVADRTGLGREAGEDVDNEGEAEPDQNLATLIVASAAGLMGGNLILNRKTPSDEDTDVETAE